MSLFMALVVIASFLLVLFLFACAADALDGFRWAATKRAWARTDTRWDRQARIAKRKLLASVVSHRAFLFNVNLKARTDEWANRFAGKVSHALYTKSLAAAEAEVDYTKWGLIADANRLSDCSQVRAVGGSGQPCGDCIPCWREEDLTQGLSDLHGVAFDKLHKLQDQQSAAYLSMLPDEPRMERCSIR
jgi:hypothetical protein